MKTALQRGFTLIELIVVMAVIAILAGIVLVGLNPIEQTNKATDASLTETVAKLGEASLRYQIAKGTLPDEVATNTWQTELLTNKDVKAVATNGTLVTACPTSGGEFESGYCLLTSGQEFVVYTRAKSGGSTAKCGAGTWNDTYLLYSSTHQKTGVVCVGTANTAPAVNAMPL